MPVPQISWPELEFRSVYKQEKPYCIEEKYDHLASVYDSLHRDVSIAIGGHKVKQIIFQCNKPCYRI